MPFPQESIEYTDTTRYTNAKVVLVGDTGVGKTGLALRLCESLGTYRVHTRHDCFPT